MNLAVAELSVGEFSYFISFVLMFLSAYCASRLKLEIQIAPSGWFRICEWTRQGMMFERQLVLSQPPVGLQRRLDC